MCPQGEPIGAILAGGLGRRIGGSKAIVRLDGKPLISYPLQAMSAALQEIAIVVKPDTHLPSLPGMTVWIEPALPRHPLMGVTHALGMAAGRAVLVCASDLPFVTPELIARIAYLDPGGAPAVIAARDGQTQPLLGCYQPRAAGLLVAAATSGEAPLREAVSAIHPRLFEVEDPDALFNVNAPEDLLQAAAILDARSRAGVSRT
jgi:molybdenum cofactor guanylyltransferase